MWAGLSLRLSGSAMPGRDLRDLAVALMFGAVVLIVVVAVVVGALVAWMIMR